MDDTARATLLGRGLDDIFDPELRASIGTLIDDVRDRGDDAVCDALRKFDGIDLAPEQLRVTPTRSPTRSSATRSMPPSTMRSPTSDDSTKPRWSAAATGRSRANRASPWARRSRRSARSGCSRRRARRAIRASPTSSPCRPWSPVSRRSRSSCHRSPGVTATSIPPCWWCVASWGSPTCSAPTGLPASRRSVSAPRRSLGCARSSGRVRRRSRSPRWRCNATVSPR